jgi:branched-chain amino acid transport system permease protein
VTDIPHAVAERRPTAEAGHVLVAALKDAAIAALIAFGLFSLILGFRTETGPIGALELIPRPALLASAVGLVFIGRLAAVLLYHSGALAFVPRLFASSGAKDGLSTLFMRLLGPALLLFALAVPFLFYSNRYYLDLGILVLTYVMLGWGLNVVVGLACRHPRGVLGRDPGLSRAQIAG